MLDIGREGLQCVLPGFANYVEEVMRRFQRERIDGQGIQTDVQNEAYQAEILRSCPNAAKNLEKGGWVPKLRKDEREWYKFLAIEPWRQTLVLFQQFPEAVLNGVADMDATALCSILSCDAFADERFAATVSAVAVESGVVRLSVTRDDDGVSITSASLEVRRADESVPIAAGEAVEVLIRPHLQALRGVRNPIMHENLLDYQHHAACDTMDRAVFCLPPSALPTSRADLLRQLDDLRHRALKEAPAAKGTWEEVIQGAREHDEAFDKAFTVTTKDQNTALRRFEKAKRVKAEAPAGAGKTLVAVKLAGGHVLAHKRSCPVAFRRCCSYTHG